MINVSENLKNLISEDSRTFRVKVTDNLATYEEIRSFKKNIMFPSSSVSIGNALSACIECTATDIPVSITGEKITAKIFIEGSEESIKLGTFKAEKPTVKDGDISFVAYDAMKSAADKVYTSSLNEGEHTAQEYFSDICNALGEEYQPLNEADSALVIAEDKLSGYNCRDALGYLAGFLGKNCIVNRDGLFEMVSFVKVDGYTLLNEDRISEPEFADAVCCLGYINCCIDNETTLQAGTGSSGFEFISPVMTQERLDAVGETVFGENSTIKEYKACKVSQLLGDPRIEVCDVIPLTFGGETHMIPVMSVSLEYDGGLMVNLESYAPAEPQSTSLGERLSFEQKQAAKKKDSYINGIVEFSQLIQSAYGVKSTTLENITYYHNEETLSESTYIFCLTSEGFAMATGENCWGGSHKDTVWKYGISKEGDAILNMLKVFQISASLIKAGRLESNDGSTYFDLDGGVIGVNKQIEVTEEDENGETVVTGYKKMYQSQFTHHGFEVGVDKSNSEDFYQLTEIENEILNLAFDKKGITNVLLKGLIKTAMRLLKKGKIGFSVSGVDKDGVIHQSYTTDEKVRFSKTELKYNEAEGTNDVVTEEASYGMDGIKSNTPFSIEAPEIILNGCHMGNKLLWSGAELMDVKDEGITLSAPVKEQPTGIVLVFSPADSSGVLNYHYCSFFVSKFEVANLKQSGSNRHNFPLFQSPTPFSSAAIKYLYITDNKITGNEYNSQSGTGGCGIIYDNSRWYLRAVIGV